MTGRFGLDRVGGRLVPTGAAALVALLLSRESRDDSLDAIPSLTA
ncbi:hypothetical protein [Nocardiopsis sp. YSL2]|nr:hypothetical protein [Nocardiopsis sp. YSL2]